MGSKYLVRLLCLGIVVGVVLACAKPEPQALHNPLALGAGSSPRHQLAIVCSDFATPGKLVLWDLRTGQVERTGVPIHSDAIVRALPDGAGFVVVNRLGGDSLVWVRHSPLSVVGEFKLDSFQNLQDFAAISASEGWVAQLGSNLLRKVDLSTRRETGTWDLSAFVAESADGSAEPTRLKVVGNELWVQLAYLDRHSAFFAPTRNAEILRLALGTGEKLESLTLPARNPIADLGVSADAELIVPLAGLVGVAAASDGGVAAVRWGRQGQASSTRILSTEVQLGGDLVDAVVISPDLGLAIVSRPQTQVVAFRPSTGESLGALAEFTGTDYVHTQLLYDRGRELVFVVDRSMARPSVRVVDPKTLREIPEARLDLEVPPYHIELGQ